MSPISFDIRKPLVSELSPEVIDYQTYKYTTALNDPHQYPADKVRSALLSSNEDLLKTQLVSSQESKRDSAVADIIDFSTEQDALSDIDFEFLHSLVKKPEPVSEEQKQFIVEVEAAANMINAAAAQADLTEEEQGDINEYFDNLDAGTLIHAKRMILQQRLMELQKEFGDESLGAIIVDVGKLIVPGFSWYNLSNRVGDTSSVLPGNDIEEQVNYLWSLPPNEFVRETSRVIEELKTGVTGNHFDALTFMQAVISYSDQDQFWENAFAIGGDVVPFVPATKIVKGASKLKGMVRGSVQANTPKIGKTVDLPEVMDHIGKIEEATEARLVENLSEVGFDVAQMGEVKGLTDLMTRLKSFSDPGHFLGVPNRSLDAARTARITDRLKATVGAVARAVQEPELVTRLSPEDFGRAIDDAATDLQREYDHVNNTVLQVVRPNDPNQFSNTSSVRVLFGTTDGNVYRTEAGANRMAKEFLKIRDDVDVVPHGEGFVIAVTKDLDENRALWGQLDIPTDAANELSGLGSILNAVRNPKNFTSKMQSLARNSVNHGITYMGKLLGDATSVFKALDKDQLRDFSDVLTYASNKVTKGNKGRYFENVRELEDAYIELTGRIPSAKEVEAYQTFVLLNDLDYVLRNVEWYKTKVRMGTEDVTVRSGDETVRFEAVEIDDLPYELGTTENARVVFMGTDGSVSNSFLNNRKIREKIEAHRQQGYSIFQAYDGVTPIKTKGMKTPQYAQFIVSKNHTRQRVGIKTVDRREGGHHIHRYPFYIKQANVRSGNYLNDITVMNAHTAKEAEDIAKLYETARQLANSGDVNALKKHLGDRMPFLSYKQWQRLVDKKKIRLDVPFVGTRAGARTMDVKWPVDTLKQGIRDTKKSIYNLNSEANRRFGSERNVADALILREESDVLVGLTRAPKINPLEALNVGLRDVTNQRFFQDYLSTSLNEFYRQFGDLATIPLVEARADPLNTLARLEFKSGANPELVRQANLARNNIVQFSNILTPTQKQFRAFKQKILNVVYDRWGEKGLEIVDGPLLNFVTNPDVALRSIGFHLKLGLFNPVQMFLQAQSIANSIAVSPVFGSQGAITAFMMRFMGLNAQPEVIKRYAKFSGMTTEDFMESYNAMRRSGYWEVGREINYLDDVFDSDVISTVKDNPVVNNSTMFFNEGERVTRLTAWNTAYLEWKAANKGVSLDRRARQDILSRADDLALNMTRASSAVWQKGMFSVPTQFWSYQIRVMEQFLGNRVMTGPQKARAIAIYSAIYGVPTGVGVPVAFWPAADMIKRELINRGIDYDDTAFEAVMDGMASTMWEQVTGQDIDFADRLGPQGLEVVRDVLIEDASFLEILTGAPGSIIGETLASTPLYKGIMATFSPYHSEETTYRHVDWLHALRNISSVDAGVKAFYGIAYNEYISKSGTLIADDITTGEAIVSALTGASPQRITDTFLTQDVMNMWREVKQHALNNAFTEYRRAGKSGSDEEKLALVRQAQVHLQVARKAGLTPAEEARFIRRVLRETVGGVSLIENIEQQWTRRESQKRLHEGLEQ